MVAIAMQDGVEVTRAPLAYTGTPNQFEGFLVVPQPGLYEILVYAYDERSGNTGIDRTTFFAEYD